MISKEEQHAFEIEYKHVGELNFVKADRYEVTLFNGYEKKEFKTKLDAISFIKRKTAVFQNGKQLGLSVQFNKKDGNVTHLLFPNSKSENPFEVSSFYWNQIQVNVDPKERAKRMDQLEPITVTFNDVARVSAYTSPKRVKTMAVITILTIMVMLSYSLTMIGLMVAPSGTSKILGAATGIQYSSVPAMVTGFLSAAFAITAAIILFYPHYKFMKVAKDESGGYSYRGKVWKKVFVDRYYANWVAFGFMTASIVMSVLNNYYISGTIFFTSEFHTIKTWSMVGLLIGNDISLIFLMAVMVRQIGTTFRRAKAFLTAHVDPEDVDLFRAWLNHKRVESKKYSFDYLEHFTFPPTLERLRIISDEIYPKKLKMSQRVKESRLKEMNERYRIGLIKYKTNIKEFNKKQGI